MEHRYALIVGIDHYNDTSHFIPLPFAQTDARALYELLVDPERGGWLPENVVYLEGKAASRDELESQLRELFLLRAQSGDLVLFYFAGLSTQQEKFAQLAFKQHMPIDPLPVCICQPL